MPGKCGRGGPKPYLANLKKLQAKRIQRDAALAAAEKLQGTAKAEKLVDAYSLELNGYDPGGKLNYQIFAGDVIATLAPTVIAGSK